MQLGGAGDVISVEGATAHVVQSYIVTAPEFLQGQAAQRPGHAIDR